jgi:hypothetical protein
LDQLALRHNKDLIRMSKCQQKGRMGWKIVHNDADGVKVQEFPLHAHKGQYVYLVQEPGTSWIMPVPTSKPIEDSNGHRLPQYVTRQHTRFRSLLTDFTEFEPWCGRLRALHGNESVDSSALSSVGLGTLDGILMCWSGDTQWVSYVFELGTRRWSDGMGSVARVGEIIGIWGVLGSSVNFTKFRSYLAHGIEEKR